MANDLLLLADDSSTYTYDARRNRVSRTSKANGGVRTFAYSSQNRLSGYANPTTTATYAYDALDWLVAKLVGGVSKALVYDPWRWTPHPTTLCWSSGWPGQAFPNG